MSSSSSTVQPIITKLMSLVYILSFHFLLILVTDRVCSVQSHPQDYYHCQTDMDCRVNQCCTPTPNGPNVCLNFETVGQQCYFLQRTPTCGCQPGLRCVSTTPNAPGVVGDAYVCAKQRPYRRYKFAPNRHNDENDLSSMS